MRRSPSGISREALKAMKKKLQDAGGKTDSLREMAEKGTAAKDPNGLSYVLHHLKQDPAGPLVEMPAGTQSIWNPVQHPQGNKPGAGLTQKERREFNLWREAYWRARAREELMKR